MKLFKSFKFWLFFVIAIGLTFGLSIGNYIDAYTQDYGTIASSTIFQWTWPPYATSTPLEAWYGFTAFNFATDTYACVGGTGGGSITTGDMNLQTVFGSCANGAFYITRCNINLTTGWPCFGNATTNLGYVELYKYSSSSWTTEQHYDCASLTPYGFQYCNQEGGEYCIWDFASSTCILIEEKPCGENDRCGFCDTEENCNTFGTCEWVNDYVDKFKDIWNDTTEWSGGRCMMKNENWVYSTSTQTQGFGTFRQIFNDKIPFAYFYAIYDAYFQLSNQNTTTTLETLTLQIPNIIVVNSSTGATGTAMSAFSIKLIDIDFIYTILSKNTWDFIRQMIAVGLIIGLGFAISKQLGKITQIHT